MKNYEIILKYSIFINYFIIYSRSIKLKFLLFIINLINQLFLNVTMILKTMFQANYFAITIIVAMNFNVNL